METPKKPTEVKKVRIKATGKDLFVTKNDDGVWVNTSDMKTQYTLDQIIFL